MSLRRRLAGGVALGALFVVASPAPAFAHGGGARPDLPLSFVAGGAGLAVVITFMMLSLRRTEPRLQDGPRLKFIAAHRTRTLARVLRAVGLAGLVMVVLNGLIGGTSASRDIGPPLVRVGLWILVPFVAAGIGNFWRWMSPWRSLATSLNSGRPERPVTAARLGVWPATVAFAAFLWLLLISNGSTDAGVLATAAIVYTVYLLLATRWLGVESGLRSGDAFENYNGLLASISPISWTGNRRVPLGADVARIRRSTQFAYRGWLRGLPDLAVPPGMIAFIVLIIGAVAYDGMSGAEWWGRLFGRTEFEQWFGTLAIAVVVLLVGGGYALASLAVHLSARGTSTAQVARGFVHTLVPIAFAYAFAHYLTAVLLEGQFMLHAASDPFGLGWNLFGTAEWRVAFFYPTTVVWFVEVGVIIAGGIAAATLVHDRAVHLFGRSTAPRAQLALLLLIVTLVSLGPVLLIG